MFIENTGISNIKLNNNFNDCFKSFFFYETQKNFKQILKYYFEVGIESIFFYCIKTDSGKTFKNFK